MEKLIFILFVLSLLVLTGCSEKEIDRSCNTDLDCEVQSAICECNGNTKTCVNKENSFQKKCDDSMYSNLCKIVSHPIESCECVNNKCSNIYDY